MQYKHGWLVIDKPLSMTSFQVVARVRRYLGIKKIGHAGTLDPLATGVLPLAIGEATKTLPFCVSWDKTYLFTVRWGTATDTGDAEGKVVACHEFRPTKEAIGKILPLFQGIISQLPPVYSAKKVNGKRAYAYAREGKEVVLSPQHIEVKALHCLYTTCNTATFRVVCSKGTYVRSLARDIAEVLGTVGHVVVLKRENVGKFSLCDAILLDNLEELVHNAPPKRYIMPVETVLDGIPVRNLSREAACAVKQGKCLVADNCLTAGEVVSLMAQDALIAIGYVKDGMIWPKRVFNIV